METAKVGARTQITSLHFGEFRGRAARVALDLGHIPALHNGQAAVAVRTSGEVVRQDEIPAFVLGHIG